MATLSYVESSTVRAISKAREANHTHWDSAGLPMSALGTECDRALWFAFRWISEPEKLTGQKLRLFGTGNIEETRLLDDLRLIAGVTVWDRDPETGRQFKCYDIGGHLRGKLDGEVLGIPEAPKKIHVVECKSHNDENFKKLKKKGVRSAKPDHWWQCQYYMKLRGRERCLYIAVNKNTDELYSERIDINHTELLKMDARLETVISQPRPPGKIRNDASDFPCILCNHKVACHDNVFPRKSCRSCLHSTPIIDKESTDGTWLCERLNKTLTLDEQRAGCHLHLYHPDLVPGEQVNSGEDFVSYLMPDGSTWINREQPPPPPPTRYWWHPESSSLFTTDDGSHPGGDGLVEELDATEYAAAQAHFAGLAQ